MDPSTAYQRQGISVPSETMGGQLTVELYQRWIPADPYSDYPEERVDHFDKLFVWIHDHGVTIDNARLFAASINALCDIAEAS